jgi:hypothetical protein
MTHRRCLNAARKAGFSATVSERALMSRAPIEEGSVARIVFQV